VDRVLEEEFLIFSVKPFVRIVACKKNESASVHQYSNFLGEEYKARAGSSPLPFGLSSTFHLRQQAGV